MLPSTRYGAFTLAILLAARALVHAEPEALWFEPSPNWHVCPPARSAVCKGCPLPLTWNSGTVSTVIGLPLPFSWANRPSQLTSPSAQPSLRSG